MFAAAQVKEETIDDPSPPAQELTDAERTALQLQQCSSARCIEEMCKLQEEALAEGVTVPAGWHCSRHLRLTGSYKGAAYTNYHSPHGSTFRSKAAARKELGLPERPKRTPLKSGKTSTDSANARVPKQIPKQTTPGEAVDVSNFRLLADLTAAELPADLLQVQISCVETGSGIAKAGVWYPHLNQVQCLAQCCASKTVEERTMRCSGQHSFEAHCGKNPKQHHWKQIFKVNEEGHEGMSIGKFMDRRGIKLTRAKRSGAPVQQPSVLLVSNQSLHADTSTDTAMAEPASASMPHQQSVPQAPDEADLHREQHQQDSQQQDVQAMSAVAARGNTSKRRRCSQSVSAADPCIVDEPIDANMSAEDSVPPGMDEPHDADVRVPTSCEPMADLHQPSPEQEDPSEDEMMASEAEDEAQSDWTSPGKAGNKQGLGRTESAAIARLRQKQAKLNRDHRNKLRSLRRQMRKQEAEVQALLGKVRSANASSNAVHNKPEPRGQLAADHDHDVSEDGKMACGEGVTPGPSSQGQECACCKEKDVRVAKLERELLDAREQFQQSVKDITQQGEAAFATIAEENKELKLQAYRFKVLGC